MQHFIVSKDARAYQAWPDVARTGERLVCIYAECTHHGNREWTRISYRLSDDRGRTWSAPGFLTPGNLQSRTGYFWNCPRVIALADGRLVAVCERLESEKPGAAQPVFIWFSEDRGETWRGPFATPVSGICPDRLVVSYHGSDDINSNNTGRGGGRGRRERWHLATHRLRTVTEADEATGTAMPGAGDVWEERTWFSDDNGATWQGPFIIAASQTLRLCEGTLFPLPTGELVCLMRENSGRGLDAFKAVSRDGGRTWSMVTEFPIPGCHRPVGGVLRSGNIMVTFRLSQGGKGWLGWWTQNFCLAWTTAESCLASVREEACTRIMPIAYDRSPHADTGYSGWVQFPDGEIYIVYYLVDDHGLGHIRGCSLREAEIVLPDKRSVQPDLSPQREK
ncbi:MAG: glycoside hydrolase [Opitutaceae bacterium]|jgi:sialidase-1|nr:glycoside hydrolase [Opitutaceae bacterium]